jgi:hypothetical protein
VIQMSRSAWVAAAGILLIVIGGVFLLRELGFGIELGSLWAAIIIGAGILVLYGALRPRAATPSSLVIDRQGTADLALDVGAGGGQFGLRGGASALVEVGSRRDDIVSSVDRSGPSTRVQLRQNTDWFLQPWLGPAGWEIRVAPDVPVTLEMGAGAGEVTIDLGALLLRRARLNLGAAKAVVTLPRPNGDVPLAISAGAASITIVVPPGVEAKVFSHGGLLSVSGRTETPGYAAAADRVTVTVQGGAASVAVV